MERVPSDHLSEFLDLVDVRATLSGMMRVDGCWRVRTENCDRLKFLGVAQGRALLRTDAAPALDLAQGDVAVLNGRAWLELSGGGQAGSVREVVPPVGYVEDLTTDGSPADVVIGGHVDLDETGQAVLAGALPPVMHLRGALSPAQGVQRSLRLLLEETATGGPGSPFAVRQYSRLLLLEVARLPAPPEDRPPGWLRLISDERLRPAVAAIHADPRAGWSVTDLAGVAHMSRTSFTERFRTAAGLPPRAYITRWRMMLARRSLGTLDVPVGVLADQLGYGSESAFSNAFKREVGVSPQRYRLRRRRRTLAQEA
ncbi:AraC family transcriptional regulator [Serinicoccus sp. LYQ131]|uniref:AraC family transcriptional regulator n=1 Tax=Serinicoccus sp. LYQ131 TaxID=3378797 RepID=UPI0038539F65